MQPTYSFSEIKSLTRSLDQDALKILEELIEEEKDCFADYELRAFHRFIELKKKDLAPNLVKFEYLLSFN